LLSDSAWWDLLTPGPCVRYSFELEWRAFSRSDSKTLCMGTLTYTKVKPVSDSPVDSPNGDSPSRTVSVGKEREKLAHYFGMKKERANALAAELKKLVAKVRRGHCRTLRCLGEAHSVGV